MVALLPAAAMPFAKDSIDYSLYLVTDSSLLPPGSTLAAQVRAAIAGGATIVQLREKTLSTAKFIALAREIHAITRAANVPLLINDRVDVAQAVRCEGVHIGWDDVDYTTAREILGEAAIIGLSVSNAAQASAAAALEPDYLGLGPVFATPTKPDHAAPLGVRGVRDLRAHIASLSPWGKAVPAVAIGGINASNAQHLLYTAFSLSGIAVVSAIIAAPDAEAAARQLKQLARAPPPWAQQQAVQPKDVYVGDALCVLMERVWEAVRSGGSSGGGGRPMVHHVTNNVVKPLSANVTLAAGGAPIMSENMDEVAELAAVNGALVLNMGTAGKDARPLFAAAVRENNRHGNPVVFDPVGAGASRLRRETVQFVLGAGAIDVIKGNEAEIRTVAGESVAQRGVDSTPSTSSSSSTAVLVRDLARRERCIVVLTGVTDIVSDGARTFVCSNGHEFQGLVTGTGCSLASVIATALAVNRDRKLAAVLAALTAYNLAAEVATWPDGVKGPGTWAAAFVDALWYTTGGRGRDAKLWRMAKVVEWMGES